MGLGLMRAKQESAAWSETKLKQEKIKVALVQFLRINGRLPCPNNTGPWDGSENSPCLATLGRGVVPWKVLGLARADVTDGWGNFITYRVANRTPAAISNWTITTGVGAFTVNELALTPPPLTTPPPATAISIQERSSGGVLGTISTNAVVVLLSHGKNGFGARTVSGSVLPAPTGVDEVTNSTLANNTFITRNATEVTTATGGVFDDTVTYMTPNDLLQPLVDDKTLRGRSSQQYRELAIQQVAVNSCTPPLIAPTFASIQPTLGNGVITYICPAGATYSCRTNTVITNTTAGTKQLYQLSVFGGAVTDVTYANVVLAYPGISTRCP